MDQFDKRHFQWLYEMMTTEGVPAIWKGGTRRCGDYPNLENDMPGYYIYSGEQYCSMFYPAVWNHHYGVYAAKENVDVNSPAIITFCR